MTGVNVYLHLAVFVCAVIHSESVSPYLDAKSFDCGPYGFVCEGKSKLRLCEDDKMLGPAFLCPPNTVCNEESTDVCDHSMNYIDPIITRTINCRRNERIADPSVPACKGYILCIPNKNRFQGIKFKCSGNTIFNGYTRTCSAPHVYKCPLANTTKFADGGNRRTSNHGEHWYHHSGPAVHNQKSRPIDCKNYNFRVIEDRSPIRATYFCPSHATRRGETVRCTVFSNQYCLTLERDDEDQFLEHSGPAYRRPRRNYSKS